MEKLKLVIDYVVAHKDFFIPMALFILSELMSLSPKIGSNGIVDAIYKLLLSLKEKYQIK
jgi:uncharacterized membrane protein